jgi:hypothetical protein
MKTLTTSLFLLTLFCSTFLLSCGPKDADKIGDAQYCLDNATAATVSECVAKVDGLESSGAYIIRCSANFIQKGFGDPATIVATFQNLDNSGSNTTTAFLAALNFSDSTFAGQTYDYCLKTQQKGLSMLAAMVQSATSIATLGAQLGGGCTSGSATSAEIQSCIANLVNNSGTTEAQQAVQTVGQTVLDVYQSSCQTGSQVNASLCSQMTTALNNAGTTDPIAIGEQLISAWQSQ